MVFCSYSCWDSHVPIMNHREASCLERKAPTQAEMEAQSSRETSAKRSGSKQAEGEILVVVSKIKDYIREQSGMNTSAGVMEVLSDRVRELSDVAIGNAKEDGRQTVMGRDVARPKVAAAGLIRRRPG